MPKIKKRAKAADIDAKITGKVDSVEFKKHIERINNQLRIVEDSVELKFPAMEYRFNRDLKNKVALSEVEKMMSTKVDQVTFQELVERMNKVEELAANVKSPSKRSSPDGGEGDSNASESGKEDELDLDGPMGMSS